MGLFHDRIETEDSITIRYKYHAAFYVLMAVFFAAAFALPHIAGDLFGQICITPVLVGAFFIIAIIYLIDTWGPNSETRKAMKTGSVKVSGSKFSFSNPLTVVISKKDLTSSQGNPGR